MHNLKLELSLKQKLTQNTILAIKFLQLSDTEIAEYVQTQMRDNPTIEIIHYSDESTLSALSEKYVWMQKSTRASVNSDHEEYSLINNIANDDETQSLSFFLYDQIERLDISKKEKSIAKAIADNLDSKGFIDKESLTSLAAALKISPTFIFKVCNILKTLEPIGVCTENTKECLIIQLKNSKEDTHLAQSILENHLEDLAKKNYKKIGAALNVDTEEIIDALNLIKTLNPVPSNGFQSSSKAAYIKPDCFVYVENRECKMILNEGYQPEIRINPYYMELLETTTDKEALKYLKTKIREAHDLSMILLQRRNLFEKCIMHILFVQKEFFLNKEPLAPLCQKDIAEVIGVHESSVSRCLNERYIATQDGIFPVSYFFSRHTSCGKSVHSIMESIQTIIKDENPSSPFSDQAISNILNNNGFLVPRRTVAKYRMFLGFPNAKERRKQ